MPASKKPAEYLRLIPLSMVLFPGVSVPLHIFEERYKLMINECIDLAEPFGIVLDRAARPGAGALPYSVGTSCTVTEFDRLDKGMIDIVVRGKQRFRIIEMVEDRPYPAATVRYLRTRNSSPGQDLMEAASESFANYLAKLLALAGHKVSVLEMPSKPAELVSIVGSLLTISLEERQSLLEELDLTKALGKEMIMVQEQIDLLESQILPRLGVARPLDLNDYQSDICNN